MIVGDYKNSQFDRDFKNAEEASEPPEASEEAFAGQQPPPAEAPEALEAGLLLRSLI